MNKLQNKYNIKQVSLCLRQYRFKVLIKGKHSSETMTSSAVHYCMYSNDVDDV